MNLRFLTLIIISVALQTMLQFFGIEQKAYASESSCKEALEGSWKLIRDRLPEIYNLEGDPTEVRQITKEELKEYLLKKLEEEVKEFQENPSLEEMADILEVLMALQNEFGLDPKDVENLRQKKSDKKGGFTKGYIIPI